jgi:hypothetical protein
MSESLPKLPPVAAVPGRQDEAAGAMEGRELSDEELAATLRQAAERGWWASRDVVRLVARRIEEAELALLMIGQDLLGGPPSRAARGLFRSSAG